MSSDQQELARGILQAGLSRHGYLTASTIMELEFVLREMGENPVVRDPKLYDFSIFGTPSPSAPWGFRAEGHHLSLNFTLVRDTLIATSPAFFGANRLAPIGIRVAELRPGQAHYYRIQGPSFLVEYENTQNNANHIHTVWRDFDGDFGRDLLREHYRDALHAH